MCHLISVNQQPNITNNTKQTKLKLKAEFKQNKPVKVKSSQKLEAEEEVPRRWLVCTIGCQNSRRKQHNLMNAKQKSWVYNFPKCKFYIEETSRNHKISKQNQPSAEVPDEETPKYKPQMQFSVNVKWHDKR